MRITHASVSSLIAATAAACLMMSGAALAAAEKDEKKADPCAALPDVVKLDGGKHSLTRKGSRWLLKAPTPYVDELVYQDEGPDRRIYRFKRWTSNQYSCWDTGQTGK